MNIKDKNFIFSLVIAVVGISILSFVTLDTNRDSFAAAKRPQKSPTPEPTPITYSNTNILIEHGGRVSWYKGTAQTHELISFDAQVNPGSSDFTEVYTINPDGTGKQCVTCGNLSIADGYVGQPEWYPDGNYMVIQVENENSGHTRFNHMSWGEDNDLYVIKRDGTGAEKIWDTPKGNAALHPHFSKDGTKIMFAERVETWGFQNRWKNWRIVVANFNMTASGTNKLSNVKTYKPNGNGFYETHDFVEDSSGAVTHMMYSRTPDGEAYVDDIYKADINGTNPVNLTSATGVWDEHGHLSPVNSSLMAFTSSRFFDWNGDGLSLKLELYTKDLSTGVVERQTFFNDTEQQIVVSDFDWDRTGTRIVFQKADFNDDPKDPEIHIFTFSQ